MAFGRWFTDCEFNSYSIPQGWFILYQIGKTHQDGRVYAHPEQFDPGRFEAQRAEDKAKPYSYVPFGGGVRECLGKEFAKLEMKLFVVQLLREYEWELLPNQNLDLIMTPTPHPRDGLQVKFQRLAEVSSCKDSDDNRHLRKILNPVYGWLLPGIC